MQFDYIIAIKFYFYPPLFSARYVQHVQLIFESKNSRRCRTFLFGTLDSYRPVFIPNLRQYHLNSNIYTYRYRGINLPNVVVAVIQHMAVSDLLQAIFRIFPVVAAVIADRWVLGNMMGHIEENVKIITVGFSRLLTSALTSVRFAHLKYPFIAQTWYKNTGHIICIAYFGSVVNVYAPMLAGNILYIKTQ